MKIKKHIYDEIISTIGKPNPEKGGILGSVDRETITHFYYDVSGSSTEYSYTPDIVEVNKVLDDWAQNDVYFVGIVHSHNPDVKYPSCMDIEYAGNILEGLNYTDEFYLPILIHEEESLVLPYKVTSEGKKNLRVSEETIQIEE